MHAYIVIGNSTKYKVQRVQKLAQKLKVKPLEFPLVKIEDTRELNKFTALKLDKPTAIIINSIDRATEEAQNAFLKNLEEPQENLFYILTATNLAKILPTIVSRCQIIKMPNAKCQMPNENSETFIKLSVGEKLAFCDKIKDRGEAKEWVGDLVNFLHEQLLQENNPLNTAKNLEVCLASLNNLEANGNVNLQLSNLVINLI